MSILSTLVFPISLILDCKQYTEQCFYLNYRTYFNPEKTRLLLDIDNYCYLEVKFSNGESWGLMALAKLYNSMYPLLRIRRDWCIPRARLDTLPHTLDSIPYSQPPTAYKYTSEVRTHVLNRLCLYCWILTTTPMHDMQLHDDLLFRGDTQTDEQSYWCVRVLMQTYGTAQQLRDWQTCERWIAEHRIQFLTNTTNTDVYRNVLDRLTTTTTTNTVEWKEPEQKDMQYEELKLQVLGSHEFCKQCRQPHSTPPTAEYKHLRKTIHEALPPCLHQDAWRCCSMLRTNVHLTQELWDWYCYHLFDPLKWRTHAYHYTTLSRATTQYEPAGCTSMRRDECCPYKQDQECRTKLMADIEDMCSVPPPKFMSPTNYMNTKLARHNPKYKRKKKKNGKRKSTTTTGTGSSSSHSNQCNAGTGGNRAGVKKARAKK